MTDVKTTKIGVFKCGNIASSPLFEFLLDELADRQDIKTRTVTTGSKMSPEDVEEALPLVFEFKPDLLILISPNPSLPGPTMVRERFSSSGLPSVIISDAPGKKLKADLEKQYYCTKLCKYMENFLRFQKLRGGLRKIKRKIKGMKKIKSESKEAGAYQNAKEHEHHDRGLLKVDNRKLTSHSKQEKKYDFEIDVFLRLHAAKNTNPEYSKKKDKEDEKNCNRRNSTEYFFHWPHCYSFTKSSHFTYRSSLPFTTLKKALFSFFVNGPGPVVIFL